MICQRQHVSACKCAVALTTALVLSTATHAHHPWIMAEPAQAKAGEVIRVVPYFGHAFPGDERMETDRLAAATVNSPEGQQTSLDLSGGHELTTPPVEKTGVYVIGVRQARGYWTQTTEGGQRRPRSEVTNALRCSYSDNGSKTLVTVGHEGPSAAGNAIGHRLEIIPLAEPTTLSVGDRLPVQILFDGQPHAGPLMAFHGNSGEDPYEITATGKDGRGQVVLQGQGPWLLLAHGEIDYSDPSVCDVESFNASLTFGSFQSN